MLRPLPIAFQNALKAQLGDEYPELERALSQNTPVSIRFNAKKEATQIQNLLPTQTSVAWYQQSAYLSKRPIFTLDPAFHAGAYYVQEASSMFIGEALRQSIDTHNSLSIIDLCAAPGGKTTLLADTVSDTSLVLANEVIKNRFDILKENIQKWGYPNVHALRYDTEVLKNGLENLFDVVLTDAPCSGEGLFRKDPNAIKEWSPENVNTCAARQKRILANAVHLLKNGGVLLYSTCTYNDFENMDNVLWLIETFGLESLRLELQKDWGIVEKRKTISVKNPRNESENATLKNANNDFENHPFKNDRKESQVFGYQFYPHRVQGEGFFVSVFRKPMKENSDKPSKISKKNNFDFKNLAKLPLKQIDIVKNYFDAPNDFDFYQKTTGQILCFPKAQQLLLKQISNILPAHSFGLEIGIFKGNDFIPTHEFALSTVISKKLPHIDLNRDQALHFLKKESPTLDEIPKQGWYLARYEGLNLGWMKVLNHRINNYLPKDFKIRMSID
jgi:16S rRNA C967 or C1407 C5-methylase (RsmB/RsmF family)/NOL1/NOP2/fmu family ribosome biogenesis protein